MDALEFIWNQCNVLWARLTIFLSCSQLETFEIISDKGKNRPWHHLSSSCCWSMLRQGMVTSLCPSFPDLHPTPKHFIPQKECKHYLGIILDTQFEISVTAALLLTTADGKLGYTLFKTKPLLFIRHSNSLEGFNHLMNCSKDSGKNETSEPAEVTLQNPAPAYLSISWCKVSLWRCRAPDKLAAFSCLWISRILKGTR